MIEQLCGHPVPTKINPAQLLSGCWISHLLDRLVGWIVLVGICINTIFSSKMLSSFDFQKASVTVG